MKDILESYQRYRKDPWAFLSECVYTLDQVDKKNPIKRFPDRDYLRLISRVWDKYPLLALPKSRRMTCSWTLIGLYVWDTIFHKGRFQAFVSKKEDDAHELVMRAKFIIDHLENIPKDLIPKYKQKFCILEFPEIQSKIQGFPQGADQLRQFTFSGILGDECAFWESAQEFYAASFPTIDGGGRMSLISSPAPGFFKRLCYDAMDKIGDINVAEYAPDYKVPMQGVRIWSNKKNKFIVAELHYTADPEKRSESYKESIKNSMPLQEYLREYELHWDTFAGAPVYPEFSKLHLTDEEPVPQPGIPMLIGFDFGLTPAAIIGQYQEDQLVIFKEYIEINMGAERFSEVVIRDIKMRWPTFSDLAKNWMCFIDPSGVFRKDTDETTCAQILNTKGFRTVPGPIAWEDRRHAVVHFLTRMTSGGPAFRIYGRECPVLVKGFEGGYRFSEKALEVEPNRVRPIKDSYSHPHDALQYLCSGVRSTTTRLRREIPRPHYSTLKESEEEQLWRQVR